MYCMPCFPGYERTPIVDGVPEGWSKSTVSDAFDMIDCAERPTNQRTNRLSDEAPCPEAPTVMKILFPLCL